MKKKQNKIIREKETKQSNTTANDKIFVWDKFSDQPYVIKDKQYKKNMRKKYILEYLFSYIYFFICLPFFVIFMIIINLFQQTKPKKLKIGLGVNLDKGDMQQQLINELGVKELLIRVPLNDIKNINKYVTFAKSFGDDKIITINILQDRYHIQNLNKLKKSLKVIFDSFDGICNEYQIANAINRIKWGFFSISEYLYFYKIAQDVRDNYNLNIKLIAPSVIDFEYQYIFSTLFNFKKIKFDVLSNLLYVDRRGSPYNRQLGFNLSNKISLLYAMNKLSVKTKNKIYITEANWPLSNTAPYAPTSEKECVDEKKYALYMREYFDIVIKSNKIDKVFWHQLLAKGYGLAYSKNGKIIKYKAFDEFKEIVSINHNE